MDKILVEVSIGELLDKISILDIKKNKIKDETKLEHILNEYNILKEEWSCEKNADFGDEFIKLSRDVHFLNDERAKIKLEINIHTGSKIKEIKEYTKY